MNMLIEDQAYRVSSVLQRLSKRHQKDFINTFKTKDDDIEPLRCEINLLQEIIAINQRLQETKHHGIFFIRSNPETMDIVALCYEKSLDFDDTLYYSDLQNQQIMEKVQSYLDECKIKFRQSIDYTEQQKPDIETIDRYLNQSLKSVVPQKQEYIETKAQPDSHTAPIESSTAKQIARKKKQHTIISAFWKQIKPHVTTIVVLSIILIVAVTLVTIPSLGIGGLIGGLVVFGIFVLIGLSKFIHHVFCKSQN